MTTSAYMPFYIGDYLADTMHFSALEHGCYLLLIFAYWQTGSPLPTDIQSLAQICRVTPKVMRKVFPKVALQFHLSEHCGVPKWHHKRIDKELEKYRKKLEQTRAAGQNGAASRWGKNDSERYASVMRTPMANRWQSESESEDINIDVNIKPTVTSRAPALYAINDDQTKLVPVGTSSGRRELLECLEQNFSPETIVNGMRANGKLLHMLDVWEASGVTREDVEAEILHVRTFRPDAEITSPIYYLKGVLQKANERKTKGGYRNVKSGSDKLTIKQKIDIAISKLK